MLKFLPCLILIIFPPFISAQNVEYGIVHDSVQINNSAQVYSLYIPKGYNEEKAWPLIFFFDPAARASLPITLYSKIAEKHGFIAVCTYNSKNGPFEPGFESFDSILRHLLNTYKVDKQNLITSGFSGGSRLALALAVESKIIKGVIACGAGQPAADFLQTSADDRYSYISLVGNLDFNYYELLMLNKHLDQQGIRNDRFVFEGAHRWPPQDYFELAYLWIRSIKETPYRAKLKQLLLNKVDSLILTENYLQAEDFIKSIDEIDDRTIGLDSLKLKLGTYEKKLQSDKKDWSNAINKESKIIEELTNKFLEMDKELYLSMSPTPTSINFSDWSYYIRKYKRKRDRSEGFDADVYQRVLLFISANMAERSFTYRRREFYEVAIRMTEIWLEVDKDNAWANFSMARLHMLDDESEKAAALLNKMLSKKLISLHQIKKDIRLKHLISSGLIKNHQDN